MNAKEAARLALKNQGKTSDYKEWEKIQKDIEAASMKGERSLSYLSISAKSKARLIDDGYTLDHHYDSKDPRDCFYEIKW